MSNAAILARREYLREWRRKNKERVKAYNMEYWQRQADKKAQEAVMRMEEGQHGTDEDS